MIVLEGDVRSGTGDETNEKLTRERAILDTLAVGFCRHPNLPAFPTSAANVGSGGLCSSPARRSRPLYILTDSPLSWGEVYHDCESHRAFFMRPPFAGVAPPDLEEVDAMTVWPTIAANHFGRLVGRLAAIRTGWGEFFTLGKLLALATIPISLAVFGWQLMPYVCRRYTLTNRRIIIRQGLMPADGRWISLDEFDAIDIEILPGQEWHHAGDLVFRRAGIEVLRLAGVSRPDVFRQVCLTARNSAISVREVVQRQAASA